jgi:hypothetical protein
MSQAQLEKKVKDYLRKSQALEAYWQRPITATQLQAEMDRMAGRTKQPEVLSELFEALGNDPFVIAECLARPALAERLLRNWYACDQRIHGDLKRRAEADLQTHPAMAAPSSNYALPPVSAVPGGCIGDTWSPTIASPEGRVYHTAVWTGTEMILWGGQTGPSSYLNNGGRYNPSTDTWTALSTANAPTARYLQTAVWTGNEMIVWGGQDEFFNDLNTGGRYDPSTDSWTPTSTVNAPSGRYDHTAVWTGSEMIVWGGLKKPSG